MKLEFTTELELPVLETKKILTYNTFKRATWDMYFVTSIFKNCGNEEYARNYIKELTDRGSLEEYFLSILNEVKNMNEETINRVLDSSLFPIQKIDRDYSIKDYKNLNLRILQKNGTDYKTLNFEYNEEELFKNLLDENEVFVSIETSSENEINIPKSYNIFINDNEILVKILDHWYSISRSDFQKALKNKCSNIDLFQGKISNDAEGNEWKPLDDEILKSFLDDDGFCNDDKWYIIESDYLKELTIANIFEDIYFYKIKKIMFNEYPMLSEKTLEYLIQNNKIDEIKTKTLLALFPYASDDVVQETINNILSKKDSKEITLYALKLLMKGVSNNWVKKALEKMKNHSTERLQHEELYKIDTSLFNFQNDVEIILRFPDDILTADHLNEKEKYNEEKTNIRKSINNIIGEMTSSGVREKLKQLPQNEVVKKCKKGLNKIVGHNKKSYDLMSLEKLTEEYHKLDDFYQNSYLKVKDLIEKNNKKIK